jgi:nucleoside phosphorylase
MEFQLIELREQITDTQRKMLTAVWHHFCEHAERMPIYDVHHQFGGKRIAWPLLEQLGGSIIYEYQEQNGTTSYQMSFLGVLLTEEGGYYEQLLVEYLTYVVARFSKNLRYSLVTSQEIVDVLNLTSGQSVQLYHLIEMGQFWSHSMWFEAPNWNAGIPADIEDLPDDLRAYVHERAMSRYDRAVPLPAIPRDTYLQNKRNDTGRELSSRKEKTLRDASEIPKLLGQLPTIDVLLVTVTEVEAKAIFDALREESDYTVPRRFIENNAYYDLGFIGGARTFMVQSEMGTAGPSGALLTIQEGIRVLSPAAVVMVGIAFGVDPKKQQIGDILISQQILAYELQRVGSGPAGELVIRLRGDRPQAPPRMLARFRSGALDWEGPSLRFGLILSGDKLVDNQDFRDQLRILEPEAIGGEMEGAGLYAAAQRNKVDWILVKAICDWADGQKHRNKSQRQRKAARNAATFTIHVLRQSGFRGSQTVSHEPLEPAVNTLRNTLPAEFQQTRLGDYAPPDVALDIEDVQATIRELKAVLGGAGAEVEDLPVDTAHARIVTTQLSSADRRNRTAMFQKVRAIWVTGLLEHSLIAASRISLDLEERPDAVLFALNRQVQELRHIRHALRSNTPIIDIYDEVAGELLILGAPGAGKTTLLLELTRDLLIRAEQDDAHPIPVVFNLSSWAERRGSFAQWLSDQLNTQYDVPRKISRAWAETDTLLLLLDGLDEIKQEYRSECVEAINAYRTEHGLVPLVLCSRIDDYEALPTKLQLQGAVAVKSLTATQVDGYLAHAGERLASLRSALQQDAMLREMTRTPLMLSVLSLAYEGRSAGSLQLPEMADQRRIHIFKTYVQRMFERRGTDTSYSQMQVTDWLGWLAAQMQQHDQTEFFIERLHPGWLSATYRRRYNILMAFVRALIVGVACGMLFGIVVVFFLGLMTSLMNISPNTMIAGVMIGSLAFALVFGAVGINAGRRGETETVRIVEKLRLPPRRGRFSLWMGLLAGLPIALVVGLAFGPLMGLLAGLALGGTIGLLVLSRYLVADEIDRKIRPNQGISRSAYYALLTGLGAGLVSAVGVGLLMGLVFGPLYGVTLYLLKKGGSRL